MILTRTHASLVEVSVRSGKAQSWLQEQAIQGKIPATLTGDGWVMSRDDAERLVAEWRPR